MRIERTVLKGKKEICFNSVSLELMKHLLMNYEEQVIENKLETFGSIVRFTYKYKALDYTFTEEYVICEINEEEDDDEKLAKAVQIIYEKIAKDIVNNILLNN